MKRLLVVMVILLLAANGAEAKGYETQKTAGGLAVTLEAGSYPLVKGNNAMSIKITDGTGKGVTDAKVTVRFFMPLMPGMAPMSSTNEAALKGDVYRFSGNVAMEGTWKAEVSVVRPGKAPVRVMFNLDSR